MHTSTLTRIRHASSSIYKMNMMASIPSAAPSGTQITRIADADFPTRWGHFRIQGFQRPLSKPNSQGLLVEEAVALIHGDIYSTTPIIRIHSQCLTGDVFHSLRCDCRLQLELALATIVEAGNGIILYELQEGRGIGLMAKLQAYELQDHGRDTVEANVELGFKPDHRAFELPAAILQYLDVPAVRLMTNNPEKVEALQAHGIEVTERISAEVPPETTFERYLEVKREKMGHLFTAR
jgi:GTP cyclohydrolase II